MVLSSRSSHEARVWSPTAQHQIPHCAQCPDNSGRTSIDFHVCTLYRLPHGHRLTVLHLSTTCRPVLRFWLLFLAHSTAWLSWQCWYCPVWWSWPLIPCPGQPNACCRLSSRAHALPLLLCILVHQKRGFGVALLAHYCVYLPVALWISVVSSLRLQAQV